MRVFDDGGPMGNLWFEFEPDKFWCGDNEEDAMVTHQQLPTLGQPEQKLRAMWENLTEVKV